MNTGTQMTFSVLFFLGSVIVSLVTVQGNFPKHLHDMTVSRVTQNFHHTTNKYVNKQVIPQHLRASFTYLAMSSYFNRADVALPGFSRYFKKASNRELDNANLFMDYLNTRGGYIRFRDIKLNINGTMFPGKEPGIEAFEFAIEMERQMNSELLELIKQASKVNDVHLSHTVEDKLLQQKIDVIKQYGDNIAVLTRMRGPNYGLGEYEFDTHLHE